MIQSSRRLFSEQDRAHSQRRGVVALRQRGEILLLFAMFGISLKDPS
jgi:hypothetical protein